MSFIPQVRESVEEKHGDGHVTTLGTFSSGEGMDGFGAQA